jgi:hypothetical protein
MERLYFAPQCNTLLQLAKSRILQPHAQFRLTGKDEGQEFFIGRFDIRQQANFFEQLIAQRLRFIDHQRSALAPIAAFSQHALKLLEEGRLGDGGLGSETKTSWPTSKQTPRV